MENSGILLVVVDPSYREILSALLEAGGEAAEAADSLGAGLDAARSRAYGLVIIDPAEHPGDAVADIRAAADWARTVPIIAIADGEAKAADATLARPLRAAGLTDAVRRCLGGDRMNLAANQQAEKLAALIGAEQAAAMIGRFLAGLSDGVAQIDAGGDARAIGHKLGGMAGMLGFNALGAAWLSLENHGMSAWPTIRALTLEAIERHEDGLSLQ